MAIENEFPDGIFQYTFDRHAIPDVHNTNKWVLLGFKDHTEDTYTQKILRTGGLYFIFKKSHCCIKKIGIVYQTTLKCVHSQVTMHKKKYNK